MSEQILIALEAVSYVVIIIIMAVMANTMVMTARERTSEYATLKALGFGHGFVVRLIFGESLFIATIGAMGGILLLWPITHAIASEFANIFPVFLVSQATMLAQMGAGVLVGLVAAAAPSWHAARIRIVDGLRSIA